MVKKLLFLCSFLVFVIAANSQNPAGSKTIPKWKIEDVLRSFSANNDTTYVVNFWATFCKPCIEEIPDFIKTVEKYKSKKVKLLLVSLDLPSYYPAKIADFVKKNNYKTNIAWLNETNADHFCPMIDAKWSGAIPATIIVNNKTGYRKFFEDQVSAEDFEAVLKAAMGETVMNKYLAPMNAAEIIDNESIKHTADAQPMNYISFKSNDSSVYSITAGKVSTIARIEDMTIIIIETEDVFYTYANMGLTKLKTGDIVQANQFIGYATKNLDGEVALELYKNDTNGNYIKLIKDNFITRKDKKPTDHSIDSNEPR